MEELSSYRRFYWSKSNVAVGEQLLRSERTDDPVQFINAVAGAGLADGSAASAQIFLLLVCVILSSARYGRSKSAPRTDEFWRFLSEIEGDALLDATTLAQLEHFATTRHSRLDVTNTIPSPPRDISHIYTATLCCNFALDSSIVRSYASTTWERRYRSLANAIRRRRLQIPNSYLIEA